MKNCIQYRADAVDASDAVFRRTGCGRHHADGPMWGRCSIYSNPEL